MSDLTKFEGWDLDVASVDEPRVRDLEIAERARLARPRKIRDLIERHAETLRRFGELKVCPTVGQTSGGRPGREYWLNEGQSTWLASRLETPLGVELSVQMTKLWVAYRRGQIAPPTTLQLDIVHGARVRDVSALKAEVSNMCAAIAKATRLSIQRVHGWVRRTFKVASIHDIGVAIWPTVKDLLFQLMLGKITIAPARRLPPANRGQLLMFPGGVS